MYVNPFDNPHFRVADLTLSEVEITMRSNAETIGQLLGVIREWFVPMMYHYSETYYCAGWLNNLEVSLPKDEPTVALAAGLLGEIPFWDESIKLDAFDKDPIRWKKYDVSS